MATRMLVDAAHPEETRVVIMKGNRLEEFDFEVDSRKPLKGNIYLAKVTRVEPSLQAAFVEFGGNRHGFLAFNEIHPDYYQIPIADREALLAEQQAEVTRAAEAEEKELSEGDDEEETETEAEAESENDGGRGKRPRRGRRRGRRNASDEDQDMSVESVGGDEIEDEVAPRRVSSSRPYKIQEVIKRRQILLVQAVKEERGNKGAALTTYLSLPGRYCVLMPNTARGGGISRKIANSSDRSKLKKIVADLDVPQGTGVIVRTAGAARTKSEIRRDFDYLLKLWDDIRDLTLGSTAPALVYEEASLITRAIRDLYSKEIDEVLVEGDNGYRVAKDFMKRIMPSHAKKVQPYKDRVPLLHRFQIEQQLDTMYSSEVTLPSGGYVVIDTTEALVSIDVNSGKSTRGRSIEETAFKTNLEAAEEVARQLRLRDLAGLIVIDFIDMDDNRNNRAVERKLKDCLRVDRARIQVGRISPFGLLEMSRQRLRPGVQDINMHSCPACNGTGRVRSVDSATLHVLRAIEEEGIRARAAEIIVHMPTEIAIYVVNNKRTALAEIEERYGFRVQIAADVSLIAPDFRIEKVAERDPNDVPPPVAALTMDNEKSFTEPDDEPDEAEEEEEREAQDEEEGERGGRRRRRRRRGPRQDRGDETEQNEATADAEASDGDGQEERSERKGRRNNRRRRGRKDDADGQPMPFAAAAAVPNPSKRRDEPAQPAEGTQNADGAEAVDPASAPQPDMPTDAAELTQPNAGPEAAIEGAETAPVTEASEPEGAAEAAVDAPEAEAAASDEQATDDTAPTVEAEADEAEAETAEPIASEPEEPAVAEEPVEAEPVETAPVEVVLAEPTPTGPPKRGWWRKRS